MVARAQLAALDNNVNTGRNQARVHMQARHATRCAFRKPISDEKKSYNHLAGMISEVIKRCEEENAVAQPLPVQLPKNIASEPAPLKADLIQHRSRFN